MNKKFFNIILILVSLPSWNSITFAAPPVVWESIEKREGEDFIEDYQIKKQVDTLPPGEIIWKKLNETNSQDKILWEHVGEEHVYPVNNKVLHAGFEDSDFSPLTLLGNAVPTAHLLPEGERRFSTLVSSPFSGGKALGTGNQNYGSKIDLGLTDDFQLSFYVSNADDPLFSSIKGLNTQPANLWGSYGAGFKFSIIDSKSFNNEVEPIEFIKLSLFSSLELWNVGSGGCDSTGCKGKDDASPNIFNDSSKRVFTNNIIGTVSLPITFGISPKYEITFTPGMTFLPGKQGHTQGGEGNFYGNNIWLAGGTVWKPIQQLEFFNSLLMPFGPGANSFDSNLDFNSVPIYTTGLGWRLNPRIRLEGTLTNGWGLTPSTSLLTVPSSNEIGYSARFYFTSGAKDTEQIELTRRQSSLASGGLTVGTALVPPDQVKQIWTNLDYDGNFTTFIGTSLSNVFQLQLYQFGWFRDAPQNDSVSKAYLNEDGFHWRIGGKGVWLSPLRGDPLWAAGRITAGRHKDDSNQGYVFAESMQTKEFNDKFALNFNQKALWNGYENIWGLGLSTNYQLYKRLQLIPEVNILPSKINESNSTFSIRWLYNKSIDIDLYGSNAVSIMDIGQLHRSQNIRFGTRFSIKF